MIKGVKFVTIPVRDQDRALTFYTECLGFAVATDAPFDETQRWIELRIPGAETRVVLFTPPGWSERVGGFQSISFWTDSVQRTYETYVARGVTFTSPPKTEPWGTSAIFQDPDGNAFVLSSRT